MSSSSRFLSHMICIASEPKTELVSSWFSSHWLSTRTFKVWKIYSLVISYSKGFADSQAPSKWGSVQCPWICSCPMEPIYLDKINKTTKVSCSQKGSILFITWDNYMWIFLLFINFYYDVFKKRHRPCCSHKLKNILSFSKNRPRNKNYDISFSNIYNTKHC